MLLTINHTTNYEYNDNLLGLIQTTKLTPSPYNGLKIIEWSVKRNNKEGGVVFRDCLLYTSPSPRDGRISRMPSSA